jgi:hypothetical protein
MGVQRPRRLFDFRGRGAPGVPRPRGVEDAVESPRGVPRSRERGEIHAFDLFDDVLEFVGEELNEISARWQEDSRPDVAGIVSLDDRFGAMVKGQRARQAHLDDRHRAGDHGKLPLKRG